MRVAVGAGLIGILVATLGILALGETAMLRTADSDRALLEPR